MLLILVPGLWPIFPASLDLSHLSKGLSLRYLTRHLTATTATGTAGDALQFDISPTHWSR